ncbi:DNA-binding protein [Corynebacterium imitans]|nr:Rv2175c family DNA-binding protein [Corynebacterium imitans]MCG7277787.1 DNA-binding protein [Corynebacterium imitans]MDK8305764.1 Rv2175c family DNA-binding protein [Corynebacterium imitans]MDK8636770.1 Rv2175c family DNA-binding protein [Corynebacterium imitans]MDK8772385.1 Rv2175c family DNA-binding protein [Corynebacterium imitans]
MCPAALNYGAVNTLDDLLAGEELLSLPAVAEMLGVPVTKVHDLVNARKLVLYRKDGRKAVPALLFADGEMSKFITGAITVLFDGGFSEEEILSYLFTEDDSLPGRPIDALHGHGAREVIRRAQAMAF